jgi:hypothetical protein
MSGHIRRRGEQSWELKYEAGIDPHTGRRITRYQSFKGTKREAQAKLAALITAVATDTHIEPSKITIADFVRERIDQWEASAKISAKTGGALSGAGQKSNCAAHRREGAAEITSPRHRGLAHGAAPSTARGEHGQWCGDEFRLCRRHVRYYADRRH